MKKETLFETLGSMDDTYITQAADIPPKKRRWKIWTGLAACLALAFGVLIWGGRTPFQAASSQLPLSDASHGVTVTYKTPTSGISSSGDLLADLTEAELFTEFDTAIFLGTVTQVDNIELDFNGSKNYRALAQIQVEKVYRGPCQAGETVTVLLPCPILEGVWVEDTDVISQLAVGTRGIFMPMVYDETSVREENGATLALKDIAGYGFPDGERYAFLETANGLTFARWAYPTIGDADSLEEIEGYILKMIS